MAAISITFMDLAAKVECTMIFQINSAQNNISIYEGIVYYFRKKCLASLKGYKASLILIFIGAGNNFNFDSILLFIFNVSGIFII